MSEKQRKNWRMFYLQFLGPGELHYFEPYDNEKDM